MIMDLSGKHVIVTGGAGALGLAVVGKLIDAGATCTVPYVYENEAQRFPYSPPQAALLKVADLADETEVMRLYASIKSSQRLWASIHLAGGFAAGKVAQTDKKALMTQIDNNFTSCFLCCRAAVNAMLANGQGGRIVNVAARSALEWRTGAGMTAYAAAKAGVAALTLALAEEVAKDGILVNAVAPSIMDTPANRKAMPKADHSAWPKVEEVAATISFLASPENKVTRGAIVPVYGRS
jgi:NAD(P)-dependent dehydrogenase (short-subunit alcohol dehydrogenase family)